MQGKKIPKSFWYKEFLDLLKESAGNVMGVCRALGITPQSYYNYRYKDPELEKTADKIIDSMCLPMLEDIARIRALKGNDKLLMFLLRNRGGRKWNQDVIAVEFAKERIKYSRENKREQYKEIQRVPTEAKRASALNPIEALRYE